MQEKADLQEPPLLLSLCENATTMQSSSSIVSALKNYNACLLLSIVISCLIYPFAILFYSNLDTNPNILITLGLAIACFQLCNGFNFYQAITNLQYANRWVIAPYLLLPLVNVFIIIDLSKAINARLEEIERAANQGSNTPFTIRRVYKLANVSAIEKQLCAIEEKSIQLDCKR
jgi:hypothetical protein